jgi:molybdopterin converting factor small subunit
VRELDASGSTVREVLEDLSSRIPALGQRVYGDGEIRPFVNVYVDGEDVRWDGGAAAAVPDGAVVQVLPSVAGG